MIRDERLLASAKSGPRRAGKKELIKHLEGGKISRMQAVKAHCYDCLGMGTSGDCDQESCPLLPFSPFRPRNTTFSRATAEKTPIVEGLSNV